MNAHVTNTVTITVTMSFLWPAPGDLLEADWEQYCLDNVPVHMVGEALTLIAMCMVVWGN